MITIRFGVHATLSLPDVIHEAGMGLVHEACGQPLYPRQWLCDADGQDVTILGDSVGAHCYSCLAPVEDETLAVVMHGEDSHTANVFVVKREWLEAKEV